MPPKLLDTYSDRPPHTERGPKPHLFSHTLFDIGRRGLRLIGGLVDDPTSKEQVETQLHELGLEGAKCRPSDGTTRWTVITGDYAQFLDWALGPAVYDLPGYGWMFFGRVNVPIWGEDPSDGTDPESSRKIIQTGFGVDGYVALIRKYLAVGAIANESDLKFIHAEHGRLGPLEE